MQEATIWYPLSEAVTLTSTRQAAISHPTMQLLHLIAATIALPDTLPAPSTYLVNEICWALHSSQSVPHSVSK